MRELANRLIGNEQDFTFEQRIFNLVMLIAICMTSIGAVMDIFCYGAKISFNIAFSGFWLLMYYLSRFKGCFNIISVVASGVLVFVFIPYNWIFSNGSGGVFPYYCNIFIVIICVVLSRKSRILIFLSMLALVILLICRDARNAGSFNTVIASYVSMSELLIHLSVIIIFTAVLIIVYANTYMKEKARSEAYARTIEEHYRQQLYYMKSLEDMNERLKSERHDFNHHLGVIYGLLESKDAAKADEYVSRLVKTSEEYQTLVSIPYPMVRAMLNYKLSAAKEAHIELRLSVNVPEGLALPEFDLTVILGNLMDNAMEACVTVAENSRHIGLVMLFKPNYLIIQTENPVNRPSAAQDGGRGTTKPDASLHGYGLRNIEYLTQKHSGFMTFKNENGMFKADIALLIKKVE